MADSLARRGAPRPLGLTLTLALAFSLFGCQLTGFMEEEESPYWSPADGDAEEEVQEIKATGRAWSLANRYIHESRPQGAQLFLDKLSELSSDQVNEPGEGSDPLIGVPPIDDTAEDVCPLANDLLDVSLPCRDIANGAITVAFDSSSPLTKQFKQQIDDEHGDELREDERGFVSNWANTAMGSGIRMGGVQAVGVMRTLGLCDTDPAPSQRAFMIGERQAREFIAEAEEEVLADTPVTQCNTDVIAATILAVSQEKVPTQEFCEDYASDDFLSGGTQFGLHNSWARGMRQGFSDGYELMRVRLVKTWECQPAPPPEEIDGQDQDCICYGASTGRFIACFDDDVPAPPSNEKLLAMAEDTPQCVPSCGGVDCNRNRPVGDPLVIDLDGDGIKLSQHTISFDLADTGELVRIQALEGPDALVVMDVNGDGRINSGVELLSNRSMCEDRRCFDGVDALEVYDHNEDGIIDARDPAFARLQAWKDRNLNGVSEPAELTPLSQHLASISLQARYDLAWDDHQGNSALRAVNAVARDGRPLIIHDVWFSLSFNRMPMNPVTTGAVSLR